jgi:hypothetical protein
MLEIYNEEYKDLLAKGKGPAKKHNVSGMGAPRPPQAACMRARARARCSATRARAPLAAL